MLLYDVLNTKSDFKMEKKKDRFLEKIRASVIQLLYEYLMSTCTSNIVHVKIDSPFDVTDIVWRVPFLKGFNHVAQC